LLAKYSLRSFKYTLSSFARLAERALIGLAFALAFGSGLGTGVNGLGLSGID
jgi:hypothetical protein